MSGKARSAREKIIFPIVTIVVVVIAVELIASYALLLRLRITDSQPFTKTEPSYLSLINIPYKAGVRVGLFDGPAEDQPVDYRVEVDPRPAYIPDPELGYRPKPGTFVYTYSRQGGEHPKLIRVNLTRLADGTRWTGTPGTGPTAYVFGDSFVAGWGVNDEQTFSYLLQQGKADLRVKLYAVPGYGMTQAFLMCNQLHDQIKPDDIIVLGYADFYDVRNVVAPSRLNEVETWFQTRYNRQPESVMLPKAAIDDDGAIQISYVQQRCDENDGYCQQDDPPQSEMARVTAALVNAIAASTEARLFLLYFQGHKNNPVLDLIDDAVIRVSALPEDFDYSIRDNIEGLDPHPGPYWHYAISRKLLKVLDQYHADQAR